MSRRVGALALIALVAELVAATSVGAQVSATLDVGAGTAHADGTRSVSHLALSPHLAWTGRYLRVDARGTYAEYGRQGWGVHGGADASAFSPRLGPLRAELFGALWGSTSGLGGTLSEREAGGRLHLHDTALGVWAGTSWRNASTEAGGRPATRVSTGAWGRVVGVELRMAVDRLVFQDSSVPQFVTPDRSEDTLGVTNRVREFTDVMMTASWRRGRAELGAGVGRRYGLHTVALDWWHADGAWHLTPTMALTGAIGRYPPIVTTGMPGGRYATLSLRLAVGGGGPAAIPADAPSRPRLAFLARRLGPTRVLIAVTAPDARTVELMGDFTEWRPVALAPAGPDRWEIVLPLRPGVHQANVRFDGGVWQVPPATTPVGDEFGGTVGVFVVE